MKKFLPALAAATLSLPAFAQLPQTGGSSEFGKPTPHAQPAPPTAKGIFNNMGNKAPAQQADADAAKRAFDIANANLEAAKTYLGGLNDLAQTPTTWDRDGSIALFNSAQRAVTDAEERIGTLVPMAKGDWAKANDPLTKARSQLVSVQNELRDFAGPVRADSGNPQTRQNSIHNLWNTLDGASKDLKDAVGSMNVDTKIKTP